MMRTAGWIAVAMAIVAGPAASAQQETKEAKKERPSIYDPTLDARAQVKAAGEVARRDNQRILVMFGGDWCGWCHKLHGLFKADPNIRKALSEDYALVMVDTKAPNAEALLKECQGDLKSVGYPFLAVLDADGKVLTRQPTDPLEEGDHHDPKKVLGFLATWAPEKRDAAKVVDAAIAREASEDKKVFLHFGAPWCGWCHKLDNFLARGDVAKVLGKDLVDVKVDIDRMTGGKDVLAKYRKEEGGGIPWFVILDSKGQAIVDSGVKDNIGYPATPSEIARFVQMLHKAARAMDAADIARIEGELKAAPEAIEAARRERPGAD